MVRGPVGVFCPTSRKITETITVEGDRKIQFRDTGIYIQSSADGKLTISSDGSGADDIILSGNVTINNDLTISGSFSYGAVSATSLTASGATTLNGTVTLGDAKADTVTIKGSVTGDGTQNPDFDFSGSSGTFKTGTGAVTLGGDVTISGAKTFTTGTGAITLKGDVSIDADKDFDMSGGAGTFATGTGAVTLGGDVTISGAKTLTTGTGLTTVKGTLECEGNRIDDAGGAATITFDGSGNTQIEGDLTVVGTFSVDDVAVTGDFDIEGGDLQATTGTLNISKSGSMTTIKGTLNVDEAVTLDSTLTVAGTATFNGHIQLGNAKADTVTLKADVEGDGTTNADFDLSASSGAFKTTTGAITLGGNVTISGTKTFATGTGAISLNGDVTVAVDKDVVTSGSGYFQGVNAQLTNIKAHDGTACLDIADSTGALGIAGSVTIAADKNVSCAAGTTAIDWSSGTGTFDSPTGTNQLNGDVSIAAGKDFDMSAGAGTFATGTGAVSINGDTTLATTKTYTSGSGSAIGGTHIIYRDGSGNKAFEVVPATSITLGENVTISGALTFTTGTGLTTISGDYTLSGHWNAQEFSANAFQYPAPGTDWTPAITGATLGANKAAKKLWLPLNFLKIGDEIVSYKLVGDVHEEGGDTVTVDCKIVSINKADPLTTTDITGGGITQVDADGNFDAEATLSSVETVATDKQYALEIQATTSNVSTNEAVNIIGAEVKVNRKT